MTEPYKPITSPLAPAEEFADHPPCDPWLGGRRPPGIRVEMDPLHEGDEGYVMTSWCDRCGAEGELSFRASVISPRHRDAWPAQCPHCGHPLDIVAENVIRVFIVLHGPVGHDEFLKALVDVQRLACHMAVKYDRLDCPADEGGHHGDPGEGPARVRL